ncbi:actin-binding protein IPP-like [Drosophila mojavensis]|uniref:actin-binding protein IPP-like n=1 Tax=Drosophila mojavensis TaxID=7230 RepID=UPI001CD0A11F|nr:actin-binding protein IPP-like [Drosophila mojavensis]XP_043867614.1 actin-binding protein IPP-like [Drosophila mojavensis]
METEQPKKMVQHTRLIHRFIDLEDEHWEMGRPDKVDFDEVILEKFRTKSEPDILIVAGDITYGCHAVVLRHFSLLCENVYPTGLITALPKNLTKDGFLLAYDYMLKDQIRCKRRQLLELLDAARYYFIPGLVSNICNLFADRELHTEMDALNIYFAAYGKKKLGIARMMMTCVRRYFLPMVSTKEFRNMPLGCVVKLLSSDKLAVQHELEVFYAALYWIFSDYHTRKTSLNVVFRTVRFVLLPPMFLLNMTQRLHELLPRMADELLPFLEYAIVYQQRSETGGVEEEELRLRSRCLITDPECPYMQRKKQLKLYGFKHIEFLAYITKLRCMEDFLARITLN